MSVARHQAAYNGALMAYARSEACTYLGDPDPVDHASIHTFTTDGTILNTYAHFLTDDGGQIRHHSYPTSSSFLTSTYDDFKRSRRRLRNLQDCAWRNSQELRNDLLNEWSRRQQINGIEKGEYEQEVNSFTPSSSRAAPPPPKLYDRHDCTNEENPNDQLLAELKASVCERVRHVEDSGGSACIPESEASTRERAESGSATSCLAENPKDGFRASTNNAIITPPLSLKHVLGSVDAG